MHAQGHVLGSCATRGGELLHEWREKAWQCLFSLCSRLGTARWDLGAQMGTKARSNPPLVPTQAVHPCALLPQAAARGEPAAPQPDFAMVTPQELRVSEKACELRAACHSGKCCPPHELCRCPRALKRPAAQHRPLLLQYSNSLFIIALCCCCDHAVLEELLDAFLGTAGRTVQPRLLRAGPSPAAVGSGTGLVLSYSVREDVHPTLRERAGPLLPIW